VTSGARLPTGAKPPVSDAAVLAKTGRTWAQWLTILDRAKAGQLTHREIAVLLREKFAVGAWWCQMVTVGYERARGRRAVNETAQGFRAYASRTIAAPISAVYNAWMTAEARAPWLPGQRFTIRTAARNKSLRITWPDGANVEVGLTAKGPRRTIVAVQHGTLAGAAAVRGAKAFWAARLDALRTLLERENRASARPAVAPRAGSKRAPRIGSVRKK
jgi:hypothetical protein